jgi:hypothetical protein
MKKADKYFSKITLVFHFYSGIMEVQTFGDTSLKAAKRERVWRIVIV